PTRPPMRSIPLRTMARPMPVPWYVSMPCSRSKTRKMRPWCSDLMPIPLSSTQRRVRCPRFSAHTRTCGRTPGATNLAAFASRFADDLRQGLFDGELRLPLLKVLLQLSLRFGHDRAEGDRLRMQVGVTEPAVGEQVLHQGVHASSGLDDALRIVLRDRIQPVG